MAVAIFEEARGPAAGPQLSRVGRGLRVRVGFRVCRSHRCRVPGGRLCGAAVRRIRISHLHGSRLSG